MLLAVLEKRCGFKLGDKDVFLNITGGIKTEDPALDLAVCMAIVSSLHDLPIGKETVFAAEVGLTGEVRPVNRIDQRLSEAEKLGFTRFYAAGPLKPVKLGGDMEVHAFIKIQEIFASVFS
jgi:DNA repair protein RadA/Sms